MIQIVKEKMGEDIDEVMIDTAVFVKRGTILDNLQYAIDGERHENSNLYPEFSKIAQEEWFPEVAARFLVSLMKKNIMNEDINQYAIN